MHDQSESLVMLDGIGLLPGSASVLGSPYRVSYAFLEQNDIGVSEIVQINGQVVEAGGDNDWIVLCADGVASKQKKARQ